MERSYYEDLGIENYSNLQTISYAYRKLAMRWHPDRNNSANAHDNFLKIQTAYEFLKKSEHKRYYDSWLRQSLNEKRAGSPGGASYFDKDGWVHQAKSAAMNYANMPYAEFLDTVKTTAKNIFMRVLTITLSIIGLIFAVIVGKVAGFASQGATQSYLNSKPDINEREIHTLLSQELKKQQSSLPRMLDSDIRLDHVQLDGKIMTSDHTVVTFSAAEIDKQQLANLVIEGSRKTLCSVAKEAFNLGYSYNYRYFGNAGRYITSVSTNKSNCLHY